MGQNRKKIFFTSFILNTFKTNEAQTPNRLSDSLLMLDQLRSVMLSSYDPVYNNIERENASMMLRKAAIMA
jgi:hypothetical protein